MIGLRGLLLVLAVILFVIAVFSEGARYGDVLAWGLAATAAALLAEEMGWNKRFGTRR
ncbi:MAG: hypothetical protein WD067_02845 [Gaiellaceae bacterium]